MSKKTTAEKIKETEKFLKKNYDFRYNEVKNILEYKKKQSTIYQTLNDKKINSIKLEAGKRNLSLNYIETCINSDEVRKYNPFLEYFENLPQWDTTTSYIDQLCDTIKTHDDEFMKWSLPRWIIAMVASMIDDSVVNQQLPVLSGKQGVGKSTWIRKLIPESLKSYFYTGTVNPNNKDTAILIASCMLIDLDELTNLNKKETSSLKEIITKSSIKMRVPYGRLVEDFPHRASFIGSINESEFLYDSTGTRRFLCYDIKGIENHTIDMNNILAEAYYRYKNGEKFWFDEEDIQRIHTNNSSFNVLCPITIAIGDRLLPTRGEKAPEYKNATEIFEMLFNRFPTTSQLQKIGKTLVKMGFTKVKRREGKQTLWRYAIFDKKADYNDDEGIGYYKFIGD